MLVNVQIPRMHSTHTVYYSVIIHFIKLYVLPIVFTKKEKHHSIRLAISPKPQVQICASACCELSHSTITTPGQHGMVNIEFFIAHAITMTILYSHMTSLLGVHVVGCT